MRWGIWGLLLTVPASAAPLSWNELQVGQSLALTQKITLGDPEPYFPVGTELVVESSEPLEVPGAPLWLFHLRQPNCAHPEWESDMEIVTPLGNEESAAVGVQVARDCRWDLYAELKDMATPSFFVPAP